MTAAFSTVPVTAPALDRRNDPDNWVLGEACTDCLMAMISGDESGISPEWNRDAATATSADFIVALGDGEEEFSTSECIVCESALPGYRHGVTLMPR